MADDLAGWLSSIENLRARVDRDPALAERLAALKHYQQRRMERTYGDLLSSSRYRCAAQFFLVDLYGPLDFRQRDREFARIAPRIKALFPPRVGEAVDRLARLHALTEELDVAMASQLKSSCVRAEDYIEAWQRVGRSDDRWLQLALVLEIGGTLDVLTRQRWLAKSLRLMRGPARAAGLAQLQSFLERGLQSFGSMAGAKEFLSEIERRESSLMTQLFSSPDAARAELPAP